MESVKPIADGFEVCNVGRDVSAHGEPGTIIAVVVCRAKKENVVVYLQGGCVATTCFLKRADMNTADL